MMTRTFFRFACDGLNWQDIQIKGVGAHPTLGQWDHKKSRCVLETN